MRTQLLPGRQCLLSVLLLALLTDYDALAQVKGSEPGELGVTRPNAVYFEFAGNAAFYSFNYERSFNLSERVNPFLRGGFSIVRLVETPHMDAILVAETGLRIGIPRHAIDLGIGYSDLLDHPNHFIMGRLGYRFQGNKGLFLRLSPLAFA